MMKKLTFLMLLLSGVVLSACNTTAGVGKDLSSAGTAIHNEAEEHKHY